MLNDPQSILVIDHNTDSGVLLVRTLARKFPSTVIQICGDATAAVNSMEKRRHAAIVLHRTEELSCVDMLRLLRTIDPVVPILAISGIDRTSETLAAGANAFLSYEEWLRVGMIVKQLLEGEANVTGADTSAPDATAPDSTPPFSLPARGLNGTAKSPGAARPA